MIQLPKLAWYAVSACLVLVGGYVYRSHVYDSGVAQGRALAQAEANAALADARAADAKVTAYAVAKLQATLKDKEASHAQLTDQLKARLAASDLRVTKLSGDLARLHDQAAGHPGLPADPPATGGTPGTAEADYSVADLILTVNENYAICQRNSVRLVGLLDWYRSLQRGAAKAD